MKLAREFHFQNNIGMSQIICILVLTVTPLLVQLKHLQIFSYVTESAQFPGMYFTLFSLWEDMVVMKGLSSENFHFVRV